MKRETKKKKRIVKKKIKKNFSKVIVRFRPTIKGEKKKKVEGVPFKNVKNIELTSEKNNRKKVSKFGPFENVFVETDNNITVYSKSLAPMLTELNFGNIGIFTYGHSGSGKSFTLFGEGKNKGIYKCALEKLFSMIEHKNDLFLAITFAELHNDIIYDLLNSKAKCAIRDDGKGNFCVRSETQMDKKTGEVRVNPLHSVTVKDLEEALKVLEYGIKLRAVGSSETHDLSSRSHAVMTIEVVTKEIMEIRDHIIDLESKLVPIGKKRDDWKIECLGKLYPKINGVHTYVPNKEIEEMSTKYDYLVDERIEEINKIKAKHELKMKENKEIGSSIIFTDLAGSDFDGLQTKLDENTRKESRKINMSLLSLKECIRGINMKKKHVPWRNSKLTMLLKKYFTQKNSKILMISTVSPSISQVEGSLNTLKYANLVTRT